MGIRNEIKIAVLDRDGWRCVRCGCKLYYRRSYRRSDDMRRAHMHHVKSPKKGGGNGPDNLQSTCWPCECKHHGHRRRKGGIVIVGDIEKGVPIPSNTPGFRKYRILLENTKRMKVGDSFCVTADKGERITARGIAVVLGKYVKQNGGGCKFKCSEVKHRSDEGRKVRIWRVK